MTGPLPSLTPFSRPRFVAAGGGGSTLLTGLEHWWDLPGASGTDATGNFNLSISGSIGTDSGGAPDGGDAADLTGGHFTAAAGNVWNSGTAKTFGLWFNWDSDAAAGNDSLFGHNAPSGLTYNLLTDSDLKIRIAFNNTAIDSGTSAFTKGSWHCLIATSDGAGSSEIFLNGASVATGSANWQSGSATFRLGAYWNGAFPFDGKLCSAASWARVLDSSEIAEFYNSGTNLRYSDL